MKEIIFLLKKIKEYDYKMLYMITIYSILTAIFPFIWILLPTKIIQIVLYHPNDNFIIWILLFGTFSIAGTFLTNFIQGNYRMRMNKVRYNLIRDVMKYSFDMPYEYTLNKDHIEKIGLANSAVSGPNRGAGGIILKLLSVFGLSLSLVGFFGIFFQMPIWMLSLIIIVTIINSYFNFKKMKVIYNYWTLLEPTVNRMERTIDEFRNPLSKQDIVVYNFIDLFKSYYTKELDSFISILKINEKKELFYTLIISSFNLIKEFGVILGLVYLFLDNKIDISQLYLYITSLMSFMIISDNLIVELSSIQSNLDIFRNFTDLMGIDHGDLGKKTLDPKEDLTIEFDNVSFKYPKSEKYVLENINLKIKQGESIALVGENGSGKTTLVLLLCRLYRPTKGKILVNGIDIWDLDEKNYWKFLSVVFQDAMTLPFSIRENITFSEKEENLQNHYDKANFNEILKACEKGENQNLLRILDDEGVELSGGQTQKLFLLRALYKENAKLLILDEPTAALDALAESELYQNYKLLTEGKTSFFISHRLASTQFCDRIIYLKYGRIIEEGTHEELIDLRKEYYEIYQIQGKRYQEALT